MAHEVRSRVVRGDELRRMPWRNGQGSTREILREPDGDGDHWLWRLSIADISQDAAFSAFPGIDRILVLRSGNGVELRFDDGERILLDRPLSWHRFAGDRPLAGHLVDGATTDLNLMWRRDVLSADLWVPDLAEPMTLQGFVGETWIVHVISGSADLEGTPGPVLAGDTWVVEPQPAPWSVPLRGNGSALVMRLRPRS